MVMAGFGERAPAPGKGCASVSEGCRARRGFKGLRKQEGGIREAHLAEPDIDRKHVVVEAGAPRITVLLLLKGDMRSQSEARKLFLSGR